MKAQANRMVASVSVAPAAQPDPTRRDPLTTASNLATAQPSSSHHTSEMKPDLRIVESPAERVFRALERLSPQEQAVISMLYGLNGFPQSSSSEVAGQNCSNPEVIDDLEAEALRKLMGYRIKSGKRS